MAQESKPGSTRTERDSLGEVQVPADVYWGASTQRAVENFPISGLRLSREFNRALAIIKRSAAEANTSLGLLGSDISRAIVRACDEVLEGKFDSHFVVDVFQTGSGTSTNMNMNEVLARRAREHLSRSPDDRNSVHPNDHVNLGQSSNDVIPSALHLSALLGIEDKLLPALKVLEASLANKARQFRTVVKTGRTHLQDATPVTLGQEFGGYAAQVREAAKAIRTASRGLTRLALGGTAVGTGINTHPRFAKTACCLISAQVGKKMRESSNHFRSQSTIDDVVLVSASLRVLAISLKKIADDIRWMGCGPRAGFAELELPEVQPGSSIMPGKVNPVIAESLRMVCAQVQGNDLTISLSGQYDSFELNVMLPVTAHNLLQSIEILSNSCTNFALKCIDGLKATTRGPELVENGLGLATALVPKIGYDEAARLAKLAAKSGESIFTVALRETKLGERALKRLLNPLKLTRPSATLST